MPAAGMKFLSPLLTALFFGTGTVLADGAAIADAITAIQNATLQLADTVGSWDGGPLGALPIVTESTTLLDTINEGTQTAQQSANLTDLEGITVGLATITLVTDVNTTLTTLIATKSKFDHLLLTPIVLINLEQEKSASEKLSEALIAKLPATFVSTGEILADEISASFDEAIDVYSGGFL